MCPQLLLGVIALVSALMLPQEVTATPAFARQTGMACSACHFQHYPALNPFGRSFKQGGYTMIGGQGLVEGDLLSLPVMLNASLITKLRYQKSNGSTSETDTGQLQFPDEAALILGGRAGENIGFMVEAALVDAGTNYNSFKVHFNKPVDDTNYGAVVFLTDAGGAPYGFELLNTGAQRFLRVAEDRSATAAQQFIGSSGGSGSPGASEAEGFAFIASNPNFFANVTLWTPDHGSVAVNGFAHYLRGAYTPTLGSWDTGIGFQYFGGTASRSTASGGDVDTDAWFVDGQAQGALWGKPAGFYFTYGKAKNGANNYFNTNPNDQKAWSVLGEVGFMPRWTAYAGYLRGDNGAATSNEDRRFSLGATWKLRQNVQMQLWNTHYSGNKYTPKPASGGDNITSLMMFAAF